MKEKLTLDSMKIHIVYAREEIPDGYSQAIFLAGPLQKDASTDSWRKEAISLLGSIGYEGTVFSPDDRDPVHSPLNDNEFREQMEWEERCLNLADVILFWVPRHEDSYPDFATNTEWGVWQQSGKVVFGAPSGAKRLRYLLYYAQKYQVPIANSLQGTVQKALELLKDK